MKLAELEHLHVREDLTSAVARATEDVSAGQATLDQAHSLLEEAEAEKARVARLQGATQDSLAVAAKKLREAKRTALEAAALESLDSASWVIYRKQTSERERLGAELSYLGSFTAEDAERAVIVARIAERHATADMFEAQASLARLKLLAAAGDALALDPGMVLNTENAYSSRAMAEAIAIRTNWIPELERQLATHDARVAKEREIVGKTLWN